MSIENPGQNLAAILDRDLSLCSQRVCGCRGRHGPTFPLASTCGSSIVYYTVCPRVRRRRRRLELRSQIVYCTILCYTFVFNKQSQVPFCFRGRPRATATKRSRLNILKLAPPAADRVETAGEAAKQPAPLTHLGLSSSVEK